LRLRKLFGESARVYPAAKTNGRFHSTIIDRSNNSYEPTWQLIERDLSIADASDFSITDRRRHSRLILSSHSASFSHSFSLVLLVVSSPEYDYRESESVNIFKKRLALYLLEIKVGRQGSFVSYLSPINYLTTYNKYKMRQM